MHRNLRKSLELRYQADDIPPAALTFGLGLQLAVLSLAAMILIPVAVMRAAGVSESYLAWAVFAAVAISGFNTAFQAVRWGRIGGGHLLVSGSSSAFVGIAITALVNGGPAMLATLVVFTAVFQLFLAERLVLFRRILTPTVSGTVIMLVAVSIMPFVFEMSGSVPEGAPKHAAPLITLATLLTIVGITLAGSVVLRLWAWVIGLLAGAAAAAYFGLLEFESVAAASWAGFPSAAIPGLQLDFGPEFLTLLPAFLLAGVIASTRAISSNVALQKVSWRRPRPVDFRAVQGTATLDGISNVICGLAGTIPNTTYSLAAPLIELNGVAARVIAATTGAFILALAFMPKLLALILVIPGPVIAAYLFVLTSILFVLGVGIVMQDGMDYRKGIIVGLSFWLGFGLESGAIYPELAIDFADGLFSNGMVSGGLIAILLTLTSNFFGPRASRLVTEFHISKLSEIREFLTEFASRNGWDSAIADRLEAVAEETLLTLLQREPPEDRPDGTRRMRLAAARKEGGATLEFVVAPEEENLQERLALLETVPSEETRMVQESSLRLLRHLGASLKHQQYHDVDIVNVEVTLPSRTWQKSNDRA